MFNRDIEHYVGNNPVKYVDPDGRAVAAIPWIIKGAIGLGKLALKAYSAYRTYETLKTIHDSVQTTDFNNILESTDVDRVDEILDSAASGKGDFTIPGTATKEEADKAGEEWVGEDSSPIYDRTGENQVGLKSQDGQRIYRSPSQKNNSHSTGTQANYEQKNEAGKVTSNAHLNIIE